MKILGKVVEIIGRSMVLIEAKWSIKPDTVLTVFAELTSQDLIDRHGLDHLYVPKGEVRVVAKQNETFYLAEIFRPFVTGGRIVEKPSSLLSGILTHEIVKETVQGPPSASLGSSTIQVDVTRVVKVGDCVGTD